MNIDNSTKIKILSEMHKLFLEALRHREQEIIRYVAILAPALGGYIWLIISRITDKLNDTSFFIGTLSIYFVLWVGSFYSIALGYNFRYLILEIAKLENLLNIRDAILQSWPRDNKKLKKRYQIFNCIPWCTPPEIIKVFWLSFQLLLLLLIVTLPFIKLESLSLKGFLIIIGLIILVIDWIYLPIHYGNKLMKVLDKELFGT